MTTKLRCGRCGNALSVRGSTRDFDFYCHGCGLNHEWCNCNPTLLERLMRWVASLAMKLRM